MLSMTKALSMAWDPKAGPAVKFTEVTFPTIDWPIIKPLQLEESMRDV